MEMLDPLFLHGPFHRVGNSAHHRGRVVLLGDQVAVAIEEDRREIETLIEDRRVGRLQHDQRHLGGDIGQGIVDDVERNRVDRHRELLDPVAIAGVTSPYTQVQETIRADDERVAWMDDGRRIGLLDDRGPGQG